MSDGRLSKQCIESDLDESLNALGVDNVDLYWLHRDDVGLPVEDIMENMNSLISKGKMRAIGCSNWKADRIAEANAYALSRGLVPFCASQIQWSLAVSAPEAYKDPTIVCMDDYEYDWYVQNNLPVMAYSSQANGFFARAAEKGLDAINREANERFCTQANIARLERVKQYALKSRLTPTAVALGYIVCNQLPAMAVVGCNTLGQLHDTLTAADVTMPKYVVEWLHHG